MAWIGAAIGAAGGLLGGAMNASSAQSINSQNIALAQQEEGWQTQMSNTAEQRHVADLQAAGLNPALAYGTPPPVPGAAPLPQLSNPRPGDMVSNATQAGVSDYQQAQTVNSAVALNQAQAAKATADARASNAAAANSEAVNPYAGTTASQNLANMQATERQVNANVDNLVEQRPGFRADSTAAWQKLNQSADLFPLVQKIETINAQRAQLGMPRIENDAAWQAAHPGLSGWLQSGAIQATDSGIGTAAKAVSSFLQ